MRNWTERVIPLKYYCPHNPSTMGQKRMWRPHMIFTKCFTKTFNMEWVLRLCMCLVWTSAVQVNQKNNGDNVQSKQKIWRSANSWVRRPKLYICRWATQVSAITPREPFHTSKQRQKTGSGCRDLLKAKMTLQPVKH